MKRDTALLLTTLTPTPPTTTMATSLGAAAFLLAAFSVTTCSGAFASVASKRFVVAPIFDVNNVDTVAAAAAAAAATTRFDSRAFNFIASCPPSCSTSSWALRLSADDYIDDEDDVDKDIDEDDEDDDEDNQEVGNFSPASSSSSQSSLSSEDGRRLSSSLSTSSPFERNEARTSVRHFLTQRTVQSFLFLLQQCRDGHTVSWIEEFGNFKGLLSYHGTGGYNVTTFPRWDSFFVDMVNCPKESVSVRVKSRSGVGGGGRRGQWSPYLDAIGSTPSGGSAAAATTTTTASASSSSSETRSGGAAAAAVKGAGERRGRRSGFGRGSYLDGLSSSSSSSSSPSVGDGTKRADTKTSSSSAPRRAVGAGASYLSGLSSSGSSSSSSTPTTKKSSSDVMPIKGKVASTSSGGSLSYLDALQQSSAADKKSNRPKTVFKPAVEDEASERYVEFTVDIDPASLVGRMMSVRAQIAREWTKDLQTLIYANNLILDNYFNHVRSTRVLEEERQQQQEKVKDNGKGKEKEDKDVTTAAVEGSKKVPVVRKGREEDTDGAEDGDAVDNFERTDEDSDIESAPYELLSLRMLLEANALEDVSSSPLRKGNFDLLCLLVTQESVRRVLREYQQRGPDKEVPFEFLKQFYLDRIDDVFDGSGRYGRHDDFVRALLMASPAIVTTEDGKVGLNDPLRIAKKIIRMRETVANEWRDVMAGIPQEHMEIQKVLLAKQLEKSIFSEVKDAEEEKQPTEVIEGGDFD